MPWWRNSHPRWDRMESESLNENHRYLERHKRRIPSELRKTSSSSDRWPTDCVQGITEMLFRGADTADCDNALSFLRKRAPWRAHIACCPTADFQPYKSCASDIANV
jgi:hypothetical protein